MEVEMINNSRVKVGYGNAGHSVVRIEYCVETRTLILNGGERKTGLALCAKVAYENGGEVRKTDLNMYQPPWNLSIPEGYEFPAEVKPMIKEVEAPVLRDMEERLRQASFTVRVIPRQNIHEDTEIEAVANGWVVKRRLKAWMWELGRIAEGAIRSTTIGSLADHGITLGGLFTPEGKALCEKFQAERERRLKEIYEAIEEAKAEDAASPARLGQLYSVRKSEHHSTPVGFGSGNPTYIPTNDSTFYRVGFVEITINPCTFIRADSCANSDNEICSAMQGNDEAIVEILKLSRRLGHASAWVHANGRENSLRAAAKLRRKAEKVLVVHIWDDKTFFEGEAGSGSEPEAFRWLAENGYMQLTPEFQLGEGETDLLQEINMGFSELRKNPLAQVFIKKIVAQTQWGEAHYTGVKLTTPVS